MGNITLTNNNTSGATMVANIFLDKYMPNANGEFVKIYLYLLRCSSMYNPDLSICKIADTFDQTEKDVIRALKYWEQKGLLLLTYDSELTITDISLCECTNNSEHKASPINSFMVPAGSLELSATADISPAASDRNEETVLSSKSKLKKHTYSPSEISRLSQNEDITQILFIAPRLLGRTLSDTDINTLLYIYDELGFSLELIEYLIEYCASRNHNSIRYLESIAISWHEKNITTVEQAKEDSKLFNNDYFSVLKAFGISGRNPVQSEIDYIRKWTTEYGFGIELILEACNRTMQTIHQPSFKYADSILHKWKEKGIRIKSEILALDDTHKAAASRAKKNAQTPKNSFNNFQQRNYNFNELEKELLANNQGGY